jgi:hypothetical protein
VADALTFPAVYLTCMVVTFGLLLFSFSIQASRHQYFWIEHSEQFVMLAGIAALALSLFWPIVLPLFIAGRILVHRQE